MGLINRYRTWKVMHLLNRIPYLLSREQFEKSDRLLIEASRVYSSLPNDVKLQKLQLEDLFIEMEKLLGGEFRRKLDKQLGAEKFSRISAPVIKGRMNVAYGKNTVKDFLVRKRQQFKRGVLHDSLNKMKQVVVERPSFIDKLSEWKNKGYDTSIVERQLRSKHAHKNSHRFKKLNNAMQSIKMPAVKQKSALVAKAKILKPRVKIVPDARIKELQDKIGSWKRQGYDTTMLENQLKTLLK